jgi:hypothetical protein
MKVRDKNVFIGVMNFGIQKGKSLLSNWARNNFHVSFCPTDFYRTL